MFELIVDNEWIYEGKYEQVEEMACSYFQDTLIHDIRIMSADDFYGIN